MLALLKTAPGVSRVHSSRRVFEALLAAGVDVPVIHHITFPDGALRWGAGGEGPACSAAG